MEYSCIHNHQSQFLEMTRTADRHPIGQLCDIFGGATPARTNKEYWENGTCPWFTVEDLHNQGAHIWKTEQHITEAALKKVKKYPVDTVLLCCTSATIGSVAYSHIPLSSNQQFNGLVVKDRNKLRPEFLFYNCTLLKDELLKQCGKTTFAFVPRGTLEKIEIFCPDIHVQNQFVKVLEQADKSKFDGFKSQFIEMFKDVRDSKSLCAICRPKQWPTIPTKDFTDDGYLVYGANGIIGHYSQYNHEHSTILMACRGASCGAINISQPKSYITGNAMCMDDINDNVLFDYLAYFLSNYDYKTIITGGAQPQITVTNLQKVMVPIPPKSQQEAFGVIVKQADKSKYYEINET